mmetsp:Transcript_33196/g.46394  ORF Transcript_33196/g.46394 Transcript_33196/m.46394 type:complete len:153 (+) Transcript_33196:81-539(+)
MRLKNRFMQFVINFSDNEKSNREKVLTASVILDSIRQSVAINFGDLVLGKVFRSMKIRHYSPLTFSFIMKTSREYYREVWAAVTTITQIRGKPVQIVCLNVSGNLKKCGIFATTWTQNFFKDIKRIDTTEANQYSQQSIEEELHSLKTLHVR